MTSQEIRKQFLEFFASKEHKIVPSAPMVIKNDPTLMFTNAGMNQFKDIFLELRKPDSPRIANSQKCLRVSGKHNDLEEVGKDTYHHTMFEMLGNWSFGNYFKKEAIEFAWEFLVEKMKIDPNRLYATVFEGDKKENLDRDEEASNLWLKYLPIERVLNGNKKDNFWEMGDTGPCGPCSEVHVDLRDDAERAKISGDKLVNKDNPLVIEIWNLVFIQYNRRQDGSLEQLPNKHVDTGMGFERLCMVVQNKKSNYDTDVFQPVISEIQRLTNIKYGEKLETDIAMRVIADHIRTISFSIADGQLPSNEKAGYVIRRILRRAVRYAFTFLNQKDPFIFKLFPTLAKVMGDIYTELVQQQKFIMNVIEEEEHSFLKTLETGIKQLENSISEMKKNNVKILDGKTAFTMYDAFGFPPDLTELILSENGFTMDKVTFDAEMQKQKDRSRNVVKQETDEWTIVKEDDQQEFVGYEQTTTDVMITRYRKAKVKGNTVFHLVFNVTPFYAESGGQVGDKGYIKNETETIDIIDVQKEHNLSIHIVNELPKNINSKFYAVVSESERQKTTANHSATHLLHNALRKVLGTHVEQKGSLVDSTRLRFDFAHYQKLTANEISRIEKIVNQNIRKNIQLDEKRNVSMDKAKEMGAMALFGEKYGDSVRVIKFGESVELCGGTHIDNTGKIGVLKIVSETAIAAGIRRIEAITGEQVEEFINNLENSLDEIKETLKAGADVVDKVKKLAEQNKELTKQIEEMQKEKLQFVKKDLKDKMQVINGINVISAILDVPNADSIKNLSYELRGEVNNLCIFIAANINEKALLSVMLSNDLVEKGLNAINIIKEASKEIQGGGGGQPFYATAGGKNPNGLEKALSKCAELIKN